MTRALLWIVPALLLGACAFSVYNNLDLRSSGASRILIDISIALVALPLPIACLVCAVNGLRWFALAAWPGWVGVHADPDRLIIRLGPFGAAQLDADRIKARYFFELPADDVDEPFEALLPEEEQMAKFLPELTHPDATMPLRRTILRFVHGDEESISAALRPIIDRWRQRGAVTGTPLAR